MAIVLKMSSRKIAFIVLLYSLAKPGLCQFRFADADASLTRSDLTKLGQRFLGFNPSTKDLTTVVDSLLTDEQMTIDTVIGQTDTSQFYLRGYHKGFNPFAAEFDSVRTILAQQVRKHEGEKPALFYIFQTEGIAVGSEKMNKLPSCFKALDKEIYKSFHVARYNRTKRKKELVGEGVTYYAAGSSSPVLNLTWRKRNESVAVLCISFYAYPVTSTSSAE